MAATETTTTKGKKFRRPSVAGAAAGATMIAIVLAALATITAVSVDAATKAPAADTGLSRPDPRSSQDNDDNPAAQPNTHSNNYMVNQHNGPVQTNPHVYLIFWGNWSTDKAGVENRLYYFYKGIGGSPWGKVMTQYHEKCVGGTTSCTGAAAGSPSGIFRGWYKDTTKIPATPTQKQIAAEARKYARITGDYSYNAQYVIALPPGHGDSDFVTKHGDSCAWHSFTYMTKTKWISYTSLPYQPDSSRCYMNWVNPGKKGHLDGVTMVAGHEYAESLTDPGLNAWYDAQSNPGAAWENSDKCSSYARDVKFSTGTFPVEATWSNYARQHTGKGCVFS